MYREKSYLFILYLVYIFQNNKNITIVLIALKIEW